MKDKEEDDELPYTPYEPCMSYKNSVSGSSPTDTNTNTNTDTDTIEINCFENQIYSYYSNAQSCQSSVNSNEQAKTPSDIQRDLLSTLISKSSTLIEKVKLGVNVCAELNALEEDIEEAKKSLQLGPDTGLAKDWNAEFKKNMKLSSDNKMHFRALLGAVEGFKRTALVYGKIIITEVSIPDNFKTIKPLRTMGGHAGGEKYVYSGILFKFATDWQNIYGSDEAAQKAASCEMKGVSMIEQLKTYYATSKGSAINTDWVSVPLITLLDYQGHRLIAQSILPISKSTIIYGSDDGGKTVYSSIPDINHKMELLGHVLNLASHIGGTNPDTAKKIHFPVDIEVHHGFDDSYYMIDFARICPPTYSKGKGSTYLYRQFRPEFLRMYGKCLSPDACSNFDRHDPLRMEHKRNLKEATVYLLNTSIPDFAKSFSKSFRKSMSLKEIVDQVHQAGINLRYLDVVRNFIGNDFMYLKNLILLEIISRQTKNHIRCLFRELKKRETTIQPYSEYDNIVVTTLNLILGNGCPEEEIKEFWTVMKKKLNHYYVMFPDDSTLKLELTSHQELFAKAVSDGICTRCITGIDYYRQVWYQCYTCRLVSNRGVCESCAVTCHANHELSPPNVSKFYCDCENICQANHNIEKVGCGTIPLTDKLRVIGLLKLLKRSAHLTGIKITNAAWKELAQNPSTFVFVKPDIRRYLTKIKQMSFISRVEAQVYQSDGTASTTPGARMRLYPIAVKKFEESLARQTNNPILLKEYAEALVEQALSDNLDLNVLSTAVSKYIELKAFHSIYFLFIKISGLAAKTWGCSSSSRDVPSPPEQVFNVFQIMFDAITDKSRVVEPKSEFGLHFLSSYGHFLRELDLSRCGRLTDELVDKLFDTCRFLCVVKLASSSISDDHIERISQMNKKLIEIDLSDTEISDSSISHLSALPTLTQLSLNRCSNLTDSINSYLTALTRLCNLTVNHCNLITSLTFPKHINTLETLSCNWCENLSGVVGLSKNPSLYLFSALAVKGITDDVILDLMKVKRLEIIHLKGTNVTRDALLALLIKFENSITSVSCDFELYQDILPHLGSSVCSKFTSNFFYI